MTEQSIEGIFPQTGIPKKEYLVNITKKIAQFTIRYYKDLFDPTTGHPENVTIEWDKRKNASTGTCRRVFRIIQYNESKINLMTHVYLIALAVHECAHLVYDGHGKKYMEVQDFIFDKCIEDLERHNREMK